MTARVIEVRPLPDYKLALRFSDGQARVFDVEPYLGCGAFAELKKPEVFNSVKVSFDTVEWCNGVDLCPEVLYEHSKPMPEAAAKGRT